MLYSKGSLQDIPISSIYALLAFTKTSGVLILEEERYGITSKLYFKEGIATFASTNDIDLRLSSILLKNSIINIENIRSTEKYITSEKRYGQILVENGIMTKDDLYSGLKEQIKEIILSVFEWQSGNFLFTQLDPEEVGEFDIEFDFPMHHLLILGIMRINSFHRLKNIFGGLENKFIRNKKTNYLLPEKIMQRYQDILNSFEIPSSILDVSKKTENIRPMIFLRNILVLYTFGLIEPHNKIILKDEKGDLNHILAEYNKLFQILSKELTDISKGIMIRLEMESLIENTKKQFPFFKSRMKLDDNYCLNSNFLSEIDLLPADQQKEILYTFLHSCFENILNIYKYQIDQSKFIEIIEKLKKETDTLKFDE